MFKHNYFIAFAVIICIYLLWTAEHVSGPKDKLKRIWRNRVEWQKEKKLRSAFNTTASIQENYNSPINKEEINLLKRGPYEKCDNIYVDLGSNIGVQIRKLFEPLKYPKSKILNSYNDILGDVVTRRESVCAFGFEANPRHFKRLRQLQDIYNALGWKTTFYNRVVWTENNNTMTIYSDDENRNEDWGAGVFDTAIPDKNTMTKFEVPTVDIASWFESIIDQYSPKTVMVKMDIEGSEYKVIPHLLRRNMLCADKISFMYMEFHNWAANGQLLNKNIVREQMASQNCVSTLLIHVDDETYLRDGMEFPTIHSTGTIRSDIKGTYDVREKNKCFTFVHIPKTAGTSMKQVAESNNICYVSKQECFDDMMNRYPNNYITVIVRNPFEHVKSQFLMCRNSNWGKGVRSVNFPYSNDEEKDFENWLRHFISLDDAEVGSKYDFNCIDPRNIQVRHLSCSKPRISGSGGHPPNHALNQALNISKALENLRAASLIGITKYFDEHLCMLQNKFHLNPIRGNFHETHGVKNSNEKLNKFHELVKLLTQKDEIMFNEALDIYNELLNDMPQCKKSPAQGASMGPIKESHDGDLIIADIFLDTKNETIAIVNSKRNVWTYKRHVKRAWTCKDIQTGLVVNGKVLPIETHGHSMVVSFGKQFVEGVQIQVSNGISEYEVRTLKRSLLNGRQFNLVAAIFISKELDQIGILERWVDWHSSMGVEHTLVYVNRKYDQPERLYMRFPNNVTFIPFWFNHDISFGDQQVQNMHALYTLKGVSKWMLSTDVDEYVICQNSLLKMLKGQSPIAFQLSSYTVDNDGHISDRPQYGSDLKGKIILNTDLATGHSVHMVTDAKGGRPYMTDMVKGNHFNVSPDVCRIAHFKRTVEVTRQIENVSEQIYPGQSLQKLKSGQNIIATIKSSAEQIWTCGWQTKPLYNYAFKNATYGGMYSGKSNDDDILLYDFGPCSHTVDDFKGTIYWFDGENHQSFTSKLRPNDVYFGGKQVSVPSVEWAFVATASIGMGVVDKILASVRPAEIGKEFLLFMASNCVAHRKKAFEQIASIDTPTAGGSCGGYTVKYKTLTTLTKSWGKNVQYYKNYKFALVMENSVAPGYITEKIVIAFMAGSIPIYYGDRTTVEKWFNPKAFIFYDPNNPEEALKKIRGLHHDDKAYFKMRNMPMIRSPTIPTLKQKLTQTAFPTPKAPRNVYFITYANSKYERAKKRIVKEAHNSNWFIRARGFGPGDLSKTFRDKYSHVLSRNRGGGYWIWKYAIIEETLKTMNTGDYLVYADAGCSINQNGKERFDEYIDMLEASDMDIISFNMPFHQEHTWTTEHIFEYFNISANDRIRTSGQHIATVLILQKGPHLRKWLNLINKALEEDALMFTDEYNAQTKYTGFKDNRHDQSVSSVTRKIVRSIVIPDDTYPPNQKEFPIWASRSKN